LLAAAVLLVALPYAWSPIYDFPDPEAFRGDQLWNPYAELHGTWQRANLHAHSRTWMGLTNGRQPGRQIVERYRALGYSVPGVSDYQRIASFHGIATLPVYEHGFNITKQHQLAIGARAVEWLDFPLWQSIGHQQLIISRVKRKADLVALAHPGARGAYTADELGRLSGYDLLEVVNGPFVDEETWDGALSRGRAVWALANDDTHDLTDPRRTAVAWTMIDAPSAATADVVDGLRAGRSYAVARTGALDSVNVTSFDALSVDGDVIRASVWGAPSTFVFIGQNGVVRETVKDAMVASYAFTAADTYVRTVVRSPQATFYLNPVIRYDGGQIPAPVVRVNVAGSWTLRGAALALMGCAAALAVGRRRRVVRRHEAPAVLADAKRKTA